MSNAIKLLSSVTIFNKYARYLPLQGRREDCTPEEFAAMLPHLEGLDLHMVNEETDETDLKGEQACSGGQCEIV